MAGSTPETTSESQGATDFSPRGADQPTNASPRGTDQPADETAPRPRNRLAAIAGGPARGAHTDAYRLRPWFTVFLAWLALLTVIALTALGRYEQGVLGAQGVWLTSVGLFYLSLCCVFFPAPTAWIVMLLASNELALIEAVPLRVLAVSCACSLASAVANLNEYHVLTFLLRYRRIAQVREARVYQRTAEWFSAAPFLVIAVVGFLPIPVDVIRWLAVICRYSRWRFLVAYFIGRTPRYALFAASAVWFDLGWLQIMVIQAVLILLATAKVVYPHIRRRSDSR